MCWNKEVSIATYITVIVLVVILYRRNVGADRHLAIFSAIFVTIQLLEFFAWLSIENEDRSLNDLVTRLILIFLWAQPLINSYMVFKGTTNLRSKYFMLLAVVVFGFMFVAAVVTAMRGSSFMTNKGPLCHLIWNRRDDEDDEYLKGAKFMGDHSIVEVLYLLGLFIPLLFIKPFKKGLALALLGAILAIIAKKRSTDDEFSSWWCWIAGVFTLGALVYKAK